MIKTKKEKRQICLCKLMATKAFFSALLMTSSEVSLLSLLTAEQIRRATYKKWLSQTTIAEDKEGQSSKNNVASVEMSRALCNKLNTIK